MRRSGCVAVVAACVVAWFALAGAAHAQNAAKPRLSNSGQVYLLRGLIDVFSKGMDDLAAKLRRRGIASTVMNHSAYESLAAQAISNYRAGNRGPIIIAGHSLGADDAIEMANILNQARVPVALVVGFGPTLHLEVPANVARVVNYYQSQSAWNGKFSPGPGFRGSLVNINLDRASDITHFNIDKIDRLHAETIARITAIMGPRRSPRPAQPTSSVAAPAGATAN